MFPPKLPTTPTTPTTPTMCFFYLLQINGLSYKALSKFIEKLQCCKCLIFNFVPLWFLPSLDSRIKSTDP